MTTARSQMRSVWNDHDRFFQTYFTTYPGKYYTGDGARRNAIQFAPRLPKTRSGKIMRRILRKIAEDDTANLGDISTLADPTVVTDLVENRVRAPA